MDGIRYGPECKLQSDHSPHPMIHHKGVWLPHVEDFTRDGL